MFVIILNVEILLRLASTSGVEDFNILSSKLEILNSGVEDVDLNLKNGLFVFKSKNKLIIFCLNFS